MHRADLARTIEKIAQLPCISCGITDGTGTYGAFIPTADCRRDELGITPDRPATILYPCCMRCAVESGRSARFRRRVEDRIIDRYHVTVGRQTHHGRTHGLRLVTA